MILKQQKMRGSVLVFSLLVLSILLSVTLTSVGVVITGKNSSRSTEKSALAFQIADGATENVLKRIYKDTDPTLSTLASNLYHDESGGQGSSSPSCSNGVISGSLPSASSGIYSVTFLANDGSVIPCSGAGYATYNEWRTKLVRVMASGSYAGATRAIDVTIKPPVCGNSTTVDDEDGNTYDIIEIGDQCWMKQNMRVGSRIDSSESSSDDGDTEYYCYDDDQGNCDNDHPNYPDGGIYYWDEAMQYSTTDAQGICPDGWHIPSDPEWHVLESYLKDQIETCDPGRLASPDCDPAGDELKPTGGSGFEANLAGYVSGSFTQRNSRYRFWSSTQSGVIGHSWIRGTATSAGDTGLYRVSEGISNSAASIRCIKD